MATSGDDEFDSFGRGIENIFSEMFGSMEGTLFDIASRSLQPLFNVQVGDDAVTATFDLPGASRDEIAITCTEDTISVEAKMTRPVRLRVASGRREGDEFVQYSKKVLLPVRVDPDQGKAKFRNGIVVVKLPRLREGKQVRIDAGPKAKRLRQ